ncbi:MAG: AAA family ATPase [Myxococcota bacterium]
MYLEHFGLKRLPFEATSNGALYVDLPEHREALNVILFGLRSGEGFVKVVGEVGTGKTALCRTALARLGEELVPVFLPDPALRPIAFLATVADELGVVVPPRTPVHVLKQRLREVLLDIARSDQRVALFIDEAQTMPAATFEALRLLSNLETSGGKLLQIVLLGQPELDVRLARYDLRPLEQRIAFTARLEPLGTDACRVYVQRRLIDSGARDPGLFTPPALAAIQRASGGIPRLINALCHKSLMAAFAQDELRVERRHVARAIGETEGLGRWRIRPLERLRSALLPGRLAARPLPSPTARPEPRA